jgi:hypothetical protein
MREDACLSVLCVCADLMRTVRLINGRLIDWTECRGRVPPYPCFHTAVPSNSISRKPMADPRYDSLARHLQAVRSYRVRVVCYSCRVLCTCASWADELNPVV